LYVLIAAATPQPAELFEFGQYNRQFNKFGADCQSTIYN